MGKKLFSKSEENEEQEQKQQPEAAKPQNQKVFIIDQPFRDGVIRLIGAGSYNATPAIPSRDILQVVNALNSLRPFNLTQEPVKPKEGEQPAAQHQPITTRVFLLGEELRNVVVNLLGAGTFQIPVMEVIRAISVLNTLRPFDITITQNNEKTSATPAMGQPKEQEKEEEGSGEPIH